MLTFKCPSCGQEVFRKEKPQAQMICPYCQRNIIPPPAAVLPYGNLKVPKKSKPSDMPGISMSAFFLGFFAAVGVPGVSFFAMTWLHEHTSFVEKWMILPGIVIAGIGVIAGALWVRQLPNFRGVGRGVAVGLIMGMMVMGPMAFCYLWTL